MVRKPSPLAQVPPPPVMCSTPKSAHPSPGPGHHLLLDTIPESEAPLKVPQPPNSGTKRLPPPTLPKPQKSRPQPPPKPKKAAESGEDSFQVTYLLDQEPHFLASTVPVDI
jgi:hypothetical protein